MKSVRKGFPVLEAKLRTWRENYYISNLLAAVAKWAQRVCSQLAFQLPRKIKKNGVAVGLPNGRTLRIARDGGINLASLLYWRGMDGYEPHTSRTLRFFFERVSTFVDVGANYGFYSLLAAQWNPALKVLAFEPVPEIYHALMKNLALNGCLHRVEANQLALAGQSGNAAFYLPASQSRDCEATGTLVGNSWQRKQGSPTLQVETVSFDDFEWQHPLKLDLVKIDVEDFEADVLAGMKQTILRDQPFIVCEILPRLHRNERTREIVASLGYTPYWITASGYIRVSRFDFERTSSNDFLLSPVVVPGEVLTDLQPLWDLKLSGDNQSAWGAAV